MKVGIDILRKSRFRTSLKRGGDTFIKRVFTAQELHQNTPEQLVSIFCIKEAVMKALELPKDSWLSISTNRKANGKIICTIINSKFGHRIHSLDTSVSHDGIWIIAVAVVLL